LPDVLFPYAVSPSFLLCALLPDENELIPRVVEGILGSVVGQVACGEHHTAALTSVPYSSLNAEVRVWVGVWVGVSVWVWVGGWMDGCRCESGASGWEQGWIWVVE
jgi:hypothetical protein